MHHSTTSKTAVVVVSILILFVIILYVVDLIEFQMDQWDIKNHMPQITVMRNSTFLAHPPHITSTNHQSKHDSLQHTDDDISSLFANPHHTINGNPLQYTQCRNAILHKENINIEQFVPQHITHLPKHVQSNIMNHLHDIIWSRELIDALNNSLSYGHLVRIRLSHDANNPQNQGSRHRVINEPLDGFTLEARSNTSINHKQLVYYHVSKCGSSSIHNMLNNHYSTTRMYWRNLLDLDGYEPLPDIDCAFTFIRHPIDRIISGYYTVLSMLNREFKHKSNDNQTEIVRLEQDYANRHPWFMHNGTAKMRFKMFVQEVIQDGYEYVRDDHVILHVATQIGSSIGAFHMWPIHFIGRVEYFEEHWAALTMEHDACSIVFDSISKSNGGTHSYTLAHAMKRMGHQNSIESEDVKDSANKKDEYKKKGLSAEHLVFIGDKELFQNVVHYYYQDFICFGYNLTHEGYLKHLDDKYSI
eukprot:127366_1